MLTLLFCSKNENNDKILLLYYQDGQFVPIDTIPLFNLDETIYTYIILDGENIISFCRSDSVLQYYPDYRIVSFFCNSYNDKYYTIRVGEDLKYILKGEPCTLISYKDYFTTFFRYFRPQIGDIFYNEDYKTISCTWSKSDDIQYSSSDDIWEKYYIQDVKGEWIKVNELGWFKWRSGNQTRIDRVGIF